MTVRKVSRIPLRKWLNRAAQGAYGIRTRVLIPDLATLLRGPSFRAWSVPLAAVGALLLAPHALATPWFGVSDNEIGETRWSNDQVRELGIPAVRVFVWWEGEESPDATDLQLVWRAMSSGARVFAVVTQPCGSSHTPATPGLRARYAEYVARLIDQTGVRDVMVWNEPNLRGFWGGDADPEFYGKLLARTYDRLAGTGVRTWAFSTNRDHGVARFIRAVGEWYRRSRRPRPLFDGVSHHPYPYPGEPWDTTHADGSYTVADTGRLLNLYERAFARTPQCGRRCGFPLVYGELGWSTGAEVWTSGENRGVPAVTADEQASILLAVRDYLAGFPRVEGVFNFELRDSQVWRTGLFYEDGTAKPAASLIFGRAPLAAPGNRTGAHDFTGGTFR